MVRGPGRLRILYCEQTIIYHFDKKRREANFNSMKKIVVSPLSFLDEPPTTIGRAFIIYWTWRLRAARIRLIWVFICFFCVWQHCVDSRLIDVYMMLGRIFGVPWINSVSQQTRLRHTVAHMSSITRKMLQSYMRTNDNKLFGEPLVINNKFYEYIINVVKILHVLCAGWYWTVSTLDRCHRRRRRHRRRLWVNFKWARC